jgi:hypothetical protein
MPHIVELNGGLAEDIAALEAQIAAGDVETATFDQLWQFSKSWTVDISTAWERATLDQKQRVQSSLFSSGLKYHPGKGILNPNIHCLFSDLEGFVRGKICLVHLARYQRQLVHRIGAPQASVWLGSEGIQGARNSGASRASCGTERSQREGDQFPSLPHQLGTTRHPHVAHQLLIIGAPGRPVGGLTQIGLPSRDAIAWSARRVCPMT